LLFNIFLLLERQHGLFFVWHKNGKDATEVEENLKALIQKVLFRKKQFVVFSLVENAFKKILLIQRVTAENL
jgi:hypothetical protein